MAKNKFVEAYDTWIKSIVGDEPIAPASVHAFECAFYSGATCALNVTDRYGRGVVIEALDDQLLKLTRMAKKKRETH